MRQRCPLAGRGIAGPSPTGTKTLLAGLRPGRTWEDSQFSPLLALQTLGRCCSVPKVPGIDPRPPRMRQVPNP